MPKIPHRQRPKLHFMSHSENHVAENLKRIHERIANACQKVGREASSVDLVAVSKMQHLDSIHHAVAAGQVSFGENRPQQLLERYEALPDCHWHQIGQLQTNKVKSILPFVNMIHVLDSEKLLLEIEKRAQAIGRDHVPCLIQVNISNEDQKAGTSAEGAIELIETAIKSCPRVHIEGLMGIAEDHDDVLVVGRQFAELRRVAESLYHLHSAQVSMKHLSMGMTQDFEIAIAEGSTIVRIGSAIFGARA